MANKLKNENRLIKIIGYSIVLSYSIIAFITWDLTWIKFLTSSDISERVGFIFCLSVIILLDFTICSEFFDDNDDNDDNDDDYNRYN